MNFVACYLLFLFIFWRTDKLQEFLEDIVSRQELDRLTDIFVLLFFQVPDYWNVGDDFWDSL